jgi:hypothetical protein
MNGREIRGNVSLIDKIDDYLKDLSLRVLIVR